MIALLKIQCPHCGAAGQVLMPPPGAIIIGPCPECNKLVAVFAGDALPLDDAIMNDGTMKEKYEHVMKALSVYVEKQVRQCFSQSDPAPSATPSKKGQGQNAEPAANPITDSEIQRFVENELEELDNPDFFKHF